MLMHQRVSGREGYRHEKVGGEECGEGCVFFPAVTNASKRATRQRTYGFVYRIGLVDPQGPFTTGGKQTRTAPTHREIKSNKVQYQRQNQEPKEFDKNTRREENAAQD